MPQRMVDLVQDMADEIRGGGLPVGAGDCDDANRLGGMAVEDVRERGSDGAGIGRAPRSAGNRAIGDWFPRRPTAAAPRSIAWPMNLAPSRACPGAGDEQIAGLRQCRESSQTPRISTSATPIARFDLGIKLGNELVKQHRDILFPAKQGSRAR